MLTKEEIIEYFKLENSHAKKELGQNFLCNKKVIENIVSLLNLKKSDVLVEIGPGLGALTDDLIGKCDNYTVVEYDAKFVDFLSRSHSKNIKIVKNNILKFKDFSANKLVGNLPYYITSDILLYVALNFKNMELASFMMQKEAYQRIKAVKGSKDYNVLNLVLDYVFDFKQEFVVSKGNFFPMPNIDSVVVSFVRKKDIDETLIKPLLTTTRALFLNRRKTIFNNMNSLTKNKELTQDILKEMQIPETARSEELDLSQFIEITKKLLNSGVIKL